MAICTLSLPLSAPYPLLAGTEGSVSALHLAHDTLYWTSEDTSGLGSTWRCSAAPGEPCEPKRVVDEPLRAFAANPFGVYLLTPTRALWIRNQGP